jgi:hypothetical protein
MTASSDRACFITAAKPTGVAHPLTFPTFAMSTFGVGGHETRQLARGS